VGALKARIAGVDAAKELTARQAEFEEAVRSSAPLKAERLEVGSRLGELQGLTKAATVARTRRHARRTRAGPVQPNRPRSSMRAEHARRCWLPRWRHLPRLRRRRAARLWPSQNRHQ
jgi:hypothetical protein